MDLRVAGVGEVRAALRRPPRRGDVRVLRVRRQVEDVAVAAGREHDRVTRHREHLAGVEVAAHDAGGAPSLTTRSSISVRGYSVHRARVHLAHQRLVRTEQELLARLAPRVERARHLRATERPVVEQSAVLACERHALRDALVDDVDRHLREPVHVRLARAVVAALDRVVEEAVDAVAVVLVVLRGVDPALRGDRVRTAGRVVERDDLHVVTELAERRRRRRAGETGADDDDVEPALVRRVDELDRELVVVPLLGERALGDCVESSVIVRTPPSQFAADRIRSCRALDARPGRAAPRSGT